MRTLPLLLLTLAAAAALGQADPTPAPPAPSPRDTAAFSRKLAAFDFNEKPIGNFETVPMYWSRLSGRGFPAYATGKFDEHLGRNDNLSFRLDINGGSVAYRYAPPTGSPAQIPITPDADYVIIAFVKTSSLAHARADLAAWFSDQDGRPLPNSEAHAQPFASSPDAPDWYAMHLFLHGPPPSAAHQFLTLQVGLLQPQQLADHDPNPLPSRFQLYQQDITGTAWFDDITVFQLPRLSVAVPPESTIAPQAGASAINMLPPRQPVALDLTVSDLTRLGNGATGGTPAPLHVALRITNPDNLLFATDAWDVTPTADHPWTHRYEHPSLPAGSYTATLDITEPQTSSQKPALIARRTAQFLTLSPAPDSSILPPAPEFGVSATRWPTDAWPALPALLHHLGAGTLQFPAWRDDLANDEVRRDGPFDALLNTLNRTSVHAIAAFCSLPPALGAKLSVPPTTAPSAGGTLPEAPLPPGSLLNLLHADPAAWRPALSFLLARDGNKVDLWQLGDTTPDTSPTTDFRFAALFARADAEIVPLLNVPRLVIPWSALYDFDAHSYPHAILDLRLPSAIKPDQLATYIHSFKVQTTSSGDPEATPILAHVEPLPAGGIYSREDRLSDFVRRIVYARSANPTCTLIDLPLCSNQDGPDELLLAYRTLIRAIAAPPPMHATVASLPLAPGVRAFLFNRNGIGTLVAWNESAATPIVPLNLPLGASARRIALSGDASPLASSPGTILTHVDISAMPMIVDNIDPGLLTLSSSFALSTTTLPAGAGAAHADVLLTNPGPDPLTATLRLMPPKGWAADPPLLHVQLAAGASLKEPITLKYPFNEPAGSKTFAAMLSCEPGAGPAALELTCPLTVASSLVTMDGFAQLLPNGDLVLQQMITNTATTSLNANAYALVPGYPRQTRFVTELKPGQTVIKRYSFPASSYSGAADADAHAIAAALAGKTASIGLRQQTDGKTLLTRTVPLD